MPKETISNVYNGDFDVEVRWGRDSSDVQIATTMRRGEPFLRPRNLVELIATWDDDARSPDNPNGARGLYSSLDQHTLNELIRVLRRARDQAFGADA